MIEHAAFADACDTLGFRTVLERIARHALTAPGRERVLALEPTSIYLEARDELQRTGEMLSLLEADDAPPLQSMPDCRITLHRLTIEASVIPADEWRTLHALLVQSRSMAVYFSRREDRCPFLASMASTLFSDKMLEYHIDRTIDEEGVVRDGASKELRRIRRELIERSGQLRRRMDAILKRVTADAIVQEDLVTMRDGRMVLPVKSEYKRSIQGFIHSSSATGQTVYIEPTETLDLNNEIRDLQFAELREIERILADLTNRLRPSAAALREAVHVLSEFDSLHARANYARDMHASIPVLQQRGVLELRQARHPILLQVKPQASIVPLDIDLGDGYTTLVITGPNAGGKSVAMKTVGLIALMAQSGIPVPCAQESVLPMYDGIHVDIGDEQSVENDLSTFSSHVQRLARIIEHADSASLVLIDEIGTGTDPAEGSALGAAILESLTARNAHVIATTHHGMLKAFAHEHPRMENAAMEFDVSTLQPTYRFRSGLPGSSYAFEITRRHGMRDSIITRARELVGTRSDALEHLLVEVERNAHELAARIRQAEERSREQEVLAEDYRSRLATLKRETRELRRQAAEEAEQLLEESNALIERTVRELREQQASTEAIKQARQSTSTMRAKVRAVRDEASKGEESLPVQRSMDAAQGPISIGDTVAMRTNPTVKGSVVDATRDGFLTVAFGMMKMRVREDELVRSARSASTVPPIMQPPREAVPRNEIDLRGMYGDDAVKALESWLYDAWTAGFKRVDIIHGKGTGALRTRVHAWLRTVEYVVDFRLGDWNEGSTGVTVVELKD